MRRAVFILALFVAGCGKSQEGPPAQALAYAPAADAATAETGSSTQPRVPSGPPMLAYAYTYGVSVPPKHVRRLVATHETACAAAGQTQCQVVASSVSERGEDQVEGDLVLRATPSWLRQFRERLASQAKEADGRIYRAEVTSEDLSRDIVDTEAALRAKITLRDRLQALLASRPGKLADLIEVERELARVQGEIDATQSQLAVMRSRVAMSTVTLHYRSASVLAPQGVWSPLHEAFGDVLGIIALNIAVMVRVTASILPWALLVAGLLWLFRKRLPRLRSPFGMRRPGTPPAA